MIILKVTFCLSIIMFTKSQDQQAVVETNYGQLRGIISTMADLKLLTKFIGIPYANPPVYQDRYIKRY